MDSIEHKPRPEEVLVHLEDPLISPNISTVLIKTVVSPYKPLDSYLVFSINLARSQPAQLCRFTVTLFLPQNEQILIYFCQSTRAINTFPNADDFLPRHRSEQDIHDAVNSSE